MFTHQSLSFKAMLKNILFKCLFLSVVVISMFASNAYAKQETVRIELQYSEKLGEETKEGKPKCKKGGLVSEVDCVAEFVLDEHIGPEHAIGIDHRAVGDERTHPLTLLVVAVWPW